MINFSRVRRVLRPGLGIYRYIGVGVLGLILFLAGLLICFSASLGPIAGHIAEGWNNILGGFAPGGSIEVTNYYMGGIFMVLGGYAVYRGFRAFIRRLVGSLGGGGDKGVMDAYRRKQTLAQGPRIVAMGGGTGLSTLLRGLKHYSSNITAIVTVTDDGGSSGRLVKEMGIMPPGDIRNCLVALADAEKRMTDLFQHRFVSARGSLGGHTIGNLLIAAFIEQCGGDYDKALELASEVLAIRGRVIPSTRAHVRLRALVEGDVEIEGETAIVGSGHRIRRIFLEPQNPPPHEDAIEAIANADLICIGPGSVYTSIIPNLLVDGMAAALSAATCPKAYICNVMTQRGESDAFTAAEHVVAINANVPTRVFDFVLVNTAAPSQATLEKYRESDQDFVTPDVERIRQMGFRTVLGNFVSDTDYVRHDPARVAARLMDLVKR